MNVYQNVDIKGELNATSLGDNAQTVINDFVYPIGSIYMSVNSTSPASLFGGTWEQLKDTFLLGAGSTYTAGTTGGSADAVVVKHNHKEYGSNTSGESESPLATYKSKSGAYGVYYDPTSATYQEGGGEYITTETVGEDGTGKNMPPYLTVYMWKRKA